MAKDKEKEKEDIISSSQSLSVFLMEVGAARRSTDQTTTTVALFVIKFEFDDFSASESSQFLIVCNIKYQPNKRS